MEQSELIFEIIKFFACKFGVAYTGGISVTKDGVLYTTIFSLNIDERPYTLMSEHNTDEEYLEYIKKELTNNRLHHITYANAKRVIE